MVLWQEQRAYHKAPIMIAEDVVAHLEGSDCFAEVEAVKPGFINLKLRRKICGRLSE